MNGYPHLQAGLDDLVGRVDSLASLNRINCSWGFTAHAAPLWTAGVSHSSEEILVGDGDLQAALDNFSSRVEFLENVSGVASPNLSYPSARAAVAGVSHPASEILVDNFSRLDIALNASFACLDRLERFNRNRQLRVDGLCGSSRNFCVAGALNSSGNDAINVYLWTCRGLNGGSDSLCAAFKPVSGSCGVRRNDCLSGFANDSAYPDTSAHFRWRCDGVGGGLHSKECRLSRAVSVNGSCGSSHNGCAAGAFGTGRFYVADNKTHYKWLCTGLNGGVNSGICSFVRRLDGACGLEKNSCVNGTLRDLADNMTHYLWRCDGIQGGRNSSACGSKKPVNGVCGSTYNSCVSGSLGRPYNTSTTYYWYCKGSDGGRNSRSCSVRKTSCSVNLRQGIYYGRTYTINGSWQPHCSNKITYHFNLVTSAYSPSRRKITTMDCFNPTRRGGRFMSDGALYVQACSNDSHDPRIELTLEKNFSNTGPRYWGDSRSSENFVWNYNYGTCSGSSRTYYSEKIRRWNWESCTRVITHPNDNYYSPGYGSFTRGGLQLYGLNNRWNGPYRNSFEVINNDPTPDAGGSYNLRIRFASSNSINPPPPPVIRTPPSGGGSVSGGGGSEEDDNGIITRPAVCPNGRCETGENSDTCPKDCPRICPSRPICIGSSVYVVSPDCYEEYESSCPHGCSGGSCNSAPTNPKRGSECTSYSNCVTACFSHAGEGPECHNGYCSCI